MNTNELIGLMAKDTLVPDTRAATRRVQTSFALAACVAIAFTLVVLGACRVTFEGAQRWQMLARELFCLAVALPGMLAVQRLSTPGRRARLAAVVVALALALMGLYALTALAQASEPERQALVWGSTWRVCSSLIALISLPYLWATVSLLRARAPTRLRAAGAWAGLAAGGLSALTYTLHCPEIGAPFLVLWYGLGMAVPALIGAIAGPRWLRW